MTGAVTPGPPPDIVIDVRCLQDPDFAERGVGRHAMALLEGARRSPAVARGARLVALYDPTLPPISARCRAAFDELCRTAYAAAERERAVWFVELSPMTHDPLFVARLLHGAAALTAAVVFDFIPLDDARRYLARPRARIDYHVALAWLARYRLFAPISRASAARLRQLVSVAEDDIVVTGAPLAPMFEVATDHSGRARAHVLVIGGGDPRKNVACAIRGHAACAALQADAVPLVITGAYAPAELDAMRTLAAEAGGDPRLVRTPGRIDEPALAALYRDAWAVVVPSYAEGFSLPVIEGMAAGVPVVASDISAHAELVSDASMRFPPDAPRGLAEILARLAADPAAAASVVTAQQPVWPRFRAAAVAERFWTALDQHAGAAAPLARPAVASGRRPRVALATPLPPDRTGVADYSSTGCAALGDGVELHVFTETANPAHPPGATSVQPLSALPHLSTAFDRVVSVIGNSIYHLEIYRLLTRYGGAAIAHDTRMLGFYQGLFGMAAAREIAGRELGRAVSAGEIAAWNMDEGKLPATLLGEVAAAARPLFMHSRAIAEQVAEQFQVPVTHLPFAIYRPWDAAALTPAARAAARARLGLDPGQIMIASFGFVHPTKAPEDCIWALQQLRGWGIPAVLHFVGSRAMRTADLAALAGSIGVAESVTFTDGFVDEASWRDHLLAADLGLQLRRYGNGAMSGALQDCLAAGLATVANDNLAAASEAPGYVRRVPDALSPVLIAEALATLIEAGAHRHRHEPERAEYAESHSFRRYAERLYAVLGLHRVP